VLDTVHCVVGAHIARGISEQNCSVSVRQCLDVNSAGACRQQCARSHATQSANDQPCCGEHLAVV